MKFKSFKFITMILIFTMLLGGILPAFSNIVFAGIYTFTLSEGESEIGVWEFCSQATIIVNGQSMSIEYTLRDNVSIVQVPRKDGLYLRKNDLRI